jgi:hypothetical protein
MYKLELIPQNNYIKNKLKAASTNHTDILLFILLFLLVSNWFGNKDGKMAVFWVVARCSLVEVYRRFRGTCSFHHRPDDAGSKNL